LWSINLTGNPSAAPAYDQTQVYIPLKDGHLVAASLVDGHTIWSREAPTTAGIATGEDLVFVAGNDAISAFSRADGAPRWTTPISATLSAPMLWDTGWLFVATEAAEIIAIRAADGVVLWRQGVGSIVRARPAPTEERVYVSLEDGHMMALSLKDGMPIWQRKLAGTPVEGAALTDRIFVGSKDNFFYCLDAKSGDVKWRWRTGADLIGAPVIDDTRVYFLSLDNVLRALDRNNGSPSAGPIRVRDLLVVAGVSTSMYAFQMKNGKPAGSYTASADLDAPPHFIELGENIPVVFVILTLDGRLEALQRSPDVPPLASHAPSQVLGAPIVSTEPIDGLPLAEDAPVEEVSPEAPPP
jgi:outer membrane protein assembly factor BamB